MRGINWDPVSATWILMILIVIGFIYLVARLIRKTSAWLESRRVKEKRRLRKTRKREEKARARE